MKLKKRTLFKAVWAVVIVLTVFSTIAFTIGSGL